MEKSQLDILSAELNIELSQDKQQKFDIYMKKFLEKNAVINLISKNDEKFLFEKHIFDSLAINKFLKPESGEVLLDIGTGGGFPSVPISIIYDNLNVVALDSIKKKIKVVEEIKDFLGLENLKPVCDRAENIDEKYDYVTARAVSSLDKILKYAIPKLKKGGYFIAYKSMKANDEIKEAEKTIKFFGLKLVDILSYKLPLEELYERNLVVFKKVR